MCHVLYTLLHPARHVSHTRPATVLCVTYRTPCSTQHVTYHTLDLPLSYASRIVHAAPPSKLHTTQTKPSTVLCVMYHTCCTTQHLTYHTHPTTLRASLSGTFLQILPDLVTPLKGHSLSPRSCPPTRSAHSERFGY